MKTEKKYKLTNERKIIDLSKNPGEQHLVTLYKIRALRNFGNVKAGELGGWIENEKNLSHSGLCWVCKEGMVCQNAVVEDNAIVHGGTAYGHSRICGNSSMWDHAIVCDYAALYDNAMISDWATLQGNSEITEYGKVRDYAKITGESKVKGWSDILEFAKLIDSITFDSSRVSGHAVIEKSSIRQNSIIEDYAFVKNSSTCDSSIIIDCAKIYDTVISGCATIRYNAEITSSKDYITFRNWWGNGGEYLTWTRSNNMWQTDQFCCTAQELIQLVTIKNKSEVPEYKRIIKYVEDISGIKASVDINDPKPKTTYFWKNWIK